MICMLSALIAVAVTVVCAWCDMRTMRIPNRLTYPAILALLGIAVVNHTLFQALAGAALSAVVPGVIHLASRRRAMGLGDVKLATCIGTALGPVAGPFAISAAFVAGGGTAAWLLLTKRARREDKVPFGPFLVAGTFTALVLHP